MAIWEAVGALASVGAAGAAGWAAFQSRASAAEANRAANTMAQIERDRRHAELCPRFRVSCQPWGDAAVGGNLRLRVHLIGPHALGALDSLTVRIRDDFHTRGEGTLTAGGPTRDQIERQVWGLYRFTPGTGPDDARADETGRETTSNAPLPVGEALVYQLEPTLRPSWATSTTQDEWKRQQGTLVRFALIAESRALGMWRLTGEIDSAGGQSRVGIELGP